MRTDTGQEKPTPEPARGNAQDGLSPFILRRWGILATSAVCLAAYSGLLGLHLRHGTLRAQVTPQTIGWYLLAFAGYIGAIIWVEKRPVSMRWIWAAAILFRLLLLFTTPTLSDDVYRYLWDGHIANQGVSPYAHTINAPELDDLAIPIRAQANNPEMASPYLPAAQWIFAGLGALFPPLPAILQASMAIFDLLSGWLIARLLALAALPARRAILYLWNPLVIVETAHGAHIDAWMVFLSLAAVWLAVRNKGKEAGARSGWAELLSPLSLALATLTKIVPVLLLPVLGRMWSWRQRLVYAGLAIGLLLPAAGKAGWGLAGPLNGTGVFGAVRIYADRWNFNSGLFAWIETWLTGLGLGEAGTWAKWLSLAALSGICLAVWLLARPQQQVSRTLRLAAIPLMGYLLLTPTVHPWYALFLLGFLPFLPPGHDDPRRYWLAAIPWLYLSGALVFSYLTYIDPLSFHELPWVPRLEWLPVLVLLLAFLISGTLRTPRAPSSESQA